MPRRPMTQKTKPSILPSILMLLAAILGIGATVDQLVTTTNVSKDIISLLIAIYVLLFAIAYRLGELIEKK